MKKINRAYKLSNGSIKLLIDIGSWGLMRRVRSLLGKWLPNLPMWKSANHRCDKTYFRNNFKWDGEHTIILPQESSEAVCQLLNIQRIRRTEGTPVSPSNKSTSKDTEL